MSLSRRTVTEVTLRRRGGRAEEHRMHARSRRRLTRPVAVVGALLMAAVTASPTAASPSWAAPASPSTGPVPTAVRTTSSTDDAPAAPTGRGHRPTPRPDGSAADPIAHDPTIIRQGDWYYVVITGDAGAADTYLPMKRSRDIVTWEELGPVFATPPQWVLDTLGVTTDDLRDLWAPEIVVADGEYRLYYAASQFGTNNSVIGLATSPTLDPDDPAYGWTDEGLVLRSTTADVHNAIDPEVSVDEAGTSWLAWGSFWSGLWIRPLDEATGKPAAGVEPTHLVDRQWAPNAVEAPALVRHGRHWYLFASFDYCCRGANSEYRTVVGRSTAITGPYVDRSGLPLLSGGGTELLRGYDEFVGPGGGDVYVDGDRTLYVHHYYDADDAYLPKLSVREVVWDRTRWPSFSDPLTGSREVGHGPAYLSFVPPTGTGAVGTVPGGAAAPRCGYEGADVRLLAASESPCQQWRLDAAGVEGWFALRNRHTNKVMESAGCNSAVGADVAQYGWLANDCQRFRLVPGAEGWVTIEARIAPDRVVDAGVACAVGDDVTIWSAQADRCQQFRVQPQGTVLLVSAETGEAVTPRGRGWKAAASGWRFTHTSDGYLRVTAGRRAELPVRGCAHAVRGQRTPGPDACDEWRLVPQADGTWSLADRATGWVVGRTHHDRYELQAPTGEVAQRFRLVQP
jgi:arabinan endo-1,5-alpha-L-arabinosidase